jgi:hypothetical protein
VDTTPPSLSISSPLPGEIISASSVTVVWSGTDETSGIVYYGIQVDNGDWIHIGLSTSYTITGLADGSHTVTVMAIDNAGNISTETVTFSLDLEHVPPPIPGFPLAAIILGLVTALGLAFISRRQRRRYKKN